MSESCETCRFSAPNDGGLPGTLECRRQPPVGTARREMSQWPKVFPEAWCGEYEAQVTQPKPRQKRPAVGEAETREQG